MSTYQLSPAAENDIDDIWDYSSAQWGEEQADRYINDIRGRLDSLVSGHISARSAADVRSGYLKSAVGRHMIYFRRLESGAIIVMRVLHQSMDVSTKLPD